MCTGKCPPRLRGRRAVLLRTGSVELFLGGEFTPPVLSSSVLFDGDVSATCTTGALHVGGIHTEASTDEGILLAPKIVSDDLDLCATRAAADDFLPVGVLPTWTQNFHACSKARELIARRGTLQCIIYSVACQEGREVSYAKKDTHRLGVFFIDRGRKNHATCTNWLEPIGVHAQRMIFPGCGVGHVVLIYH